MSLDEQITQRHQGPWPRSWRARHLVVGRNQKESHRSVLRDSTPRYPQRRDTSELAICAALDP